MVSGVVGGGHFSEKGSGANYLCLVTDPDLGPVTPDDSVAHMFGAEYQALSEFLIILLLLCIQ